MTKRSYSENKGAYGCEIRYHPALHRMGCNFDEQTVKVSAEWKMMFVLKNFT